MSYIVCRMRGRGRVRRIRRDQEIRAWPRGKSGIEKESRRTTGSKLDDPRHQGKPGLSFVFGNLRAFVPLGLSSRLKKQSQSVTKIAGQVYRPAAGNPKL